VNQPIKQPTTFMKRSTTRTQARCRSSWEPSLRREECSRSSCRLSLRRDCDSVHESFTSSRLGKAVSLERDNSSLKNTTPRLGECSSRKMGEFLLFSPRRDRLAWVRRPEPSTIRVGTVRYSSQTRFK